jgi:hypothetical protein
MKKRARRLVLALTCIALWLPAAAAAEQPDLLSYSKSSSMASNTTNVINGQSQAGTLLLLNDQKLAVRSVPLGAVKAGETVEALSEVEVTNDVITKDQQGTNIVHDVGAYLTLILADSPTATTGVELAEAQGNFVTPQMHHWTFEKSASYTATQNLSGRYLNLVMWANSPEDLTSCWTFPRSSYPNPQQPRPCGMDVAYNRGHLSVFRSGPSGTAPADATPFSLEQFSGQSIPETQPADVPTSYPGQSPQLIVAMARPIGALTSGDILAVHSELEVDARDYVRSDPYCNIGFFTRLYLSPSATSLTDAVPIGEEAGYNFTGREARQIKTLERGVVPSSATYKATQDFASPRYVIVRAWTIDAGDPACPAFGDGIRAKLVQADSFMHVARYRPAQQPNLVLKTANSGDSSELASQLNLATAAPVSVYSQQVTKLLPGDRIETLAEVQTETVHDRAAVHSALVLADSPTATSGTPLQADNFTELHPYMAALPIHDAAGWTVPAGVSGDKYVNLVMRGEFLQSTLPNPDNAIAIAPDGGRLVVQHIRPLDVTPPQTSIGSGPTGPTNNPSPSFGFSANESLSDLECKLDPNGSFQPCPSPKGYSSLADGPYTFSARAIDRAGNVGPAATSSFTVDTVPPAAPGIGSGPSGPTIDPTPSFGFTAESGASVQCSVDQGSASFGDCSSSTGHTPSSNLADGSWTFRVKATDAAGNVGPAATRGFSVDTVPPNVSVDSGPTGATSDQTPTFGFSQEAGASVQCSIDEGTADFGACSGATSHTPSSTIPDGSWTFRVRATDAAGNTATATRSFIVDTQPPPAPTFASAPEGATPDNDPSFAFSGSDVASFECRLDPNGSFQPCSSPQGYFDLPDGFYSFSVLSIDPVGNRGQPATRSFTVDTHGPAVSITKGPPRKTKARRGIFAFSADEAGAAFECKVDAGPFRACGSPFTVRTRRGRHRFEVKAVDVLGNVGPSATRSWVLKKKR